MTSLTKKVTVIEPKNIEKFIDDFWQFDLEYAEKNNDIVEHETRVEEGIPE